MLRLKHRQKISSALPALKLRYREGLAGGLHLSPEMIFGFAIIGDLTECIFHVCIGIEYRALVARNQLLLCCEREIFLADQLGWGSRDL